MHNEVHFLRGAASLMVCLFHLSLGNDTLFPSSHWIKQFFLSGYVGVEVFFVLSGYVLCYAFPTPSRQGNTGKFLLKRITRIEPPYLASILLILLLNAGSRFITNTPNPVDYVSLAGHIIYLNNLNPGTYVNIVYWTLGIEFQYYLLIALAFPFLRRSPYHLLAVLGVFFLLSSLSYPSGTALVFPYLGYFGLGVVLSFYRQNVLTWPVAISGAFLFLVQLFAFEGIHALVGGLLVSSILLYWRYANTMIKFFSMISFSLYLTHVPIGGKVINLGLRFADSMSSRYLLLFTAVIISILAAYVFYKLVEQPSLKLAKKIRYNMPTASVAGVPMQKPAKEPVLLIKTPVASQVQQA